VVIDGSPLTKSSVSVENDEGGAGSGIGGGCGVLALRLSGKSSRPGTLYNETCDFEAVEWALRKFIFLSNGRTVERSKLVFLAVFRMVLSSFLGNEKLALNSDGLSHRNGVSSGDELDVVMHS
jgi:hypothetical protein